MSLKSQDLYGTLQAILQMLTQCLRAKIVLIAVLALLSGPVLAEPTGPLVIVGGGSIPDRIRSEFLKLAGGQGEARIVVLPTAGRDADDPEQADRFLAPWLALGPASVQLLHTRDRSESDDDAFVEPLRQATGVWMSGGSQRRLAAAYRGTLVHEEMNQVLQRGGVVGGTSAGAAIMSDPMIERGKKVAQIGPGLGFLEGVIVDQHFVVRNRIGRLRGALADHPNEAGLGIDESTAVVVHAGSLTVLGDSTVTAFWPQSSQPPGQERTLGTGDVLELKELCAGSVSR